MRTLQVTPQVKSCEAGNFPFVLLLCLFVGQLWPFFHDMLHVKIIFYLGEQGEDEPLDVFVHPSNQHEQTDRNLNPDRYKIWSNLVHRAA